MKPKKFETDKTKFKLCVYYSHHSSGVPYSIYDIQQSKNRKYHDSYDFVLSKGGYITRHDLALNKLLAHLEKHKDKIIRALLFVNDFGLSKQFLIGNFGKNEEFNKFIQPIFENYNEKGIFYKELMAPPLETYELVTLSVTKNNQ